MSASRSCGCGSVQGQRPDRWDVIGGIVTIAGMAIIASSGRAPAAEVTPIGRSAGAPFEDHAGREG